MDNVVKVPIRHTYKHVGLRIALLNKNFILKFTFTVSVFPYSLNVTTHVKLSSDISIIPAS